MTWAYDSVWGDWCQVGPCRCTVEFIDRIGPDEDMLGDYSQPQQRWNVSLLGIDEYGGTTNVSLAEGWAHSTEEGQQAALAFLRTLASDVTDALAKEV